MLSLAIIGVGVGSMFALSAVGMLVLFRTTGVLNLAFGALGAVAAFAAWDMSPGGQVGWGAYVVGALAASALSVVYGAVLGPFLAAREPVVKATATLGFALVLLGILEWLFPQSAVIRAVGLPIDQAGFDLGETRITAAQVVALTLALVVTGATIVFLRISDTGRAMRALADDRELASMLGVRVRRVETLSWAVSGLLAGVSGPLLANLSNTLQPEAQVFLVIPALAACVIAQLRSIPLALAAGVLVGVAMEVSTYNDDLAQYHQVVPFVFAVLFILYQQRHRVISIAAAR
ncbi:branched-chain amino acid ABC transporter permease [Nonomuraea sp. 3N208]|uniref:branched-chain amino acid ABC transporter permease n=1 Tax=Nonomuraea sp. 3N208 TaxID=3457421 RepID=UPI003FD09CE3